MAKRKSECTPEEWATYIAARMAYKARWIAENRDKVRDASRARYAKNHERERAYQREYYAKNREQILERLKAENTPEEKQERRRETWRARYARDDVKAARQILDARPEAVKRRRKYANTASAKCRADQRLQERLRMTPGLREKRLARGRFWRTGFTQEMVAEYLAKQNNRCAVCQREFSDKVKYQADHCHDTKKPRGLLCFHCNIIEGKLLAIGMKPLEFGESLHKYLESSVGIMAK